MRCLTVAHTGLAAHHCRGALAEPPSKDSAFLLFPEVRGARFPFWRAVWDTLAGVPVPLPGLPTHTVCLLLLAGKDAGFMTCSKGATMADLKNTGNTPAVSADADNNTPHAFNFAAMASHLHGVAYERSTQPLAVTVADYHEYFGAMQAVEDAAACLGRTEKGLFLLMEGLSATDMSPHWVESLRGLLEPLARQLETHGKALAATIERQDKGARDGLA